MQRIIDDPALVVEDMLRGFVRAHPDLVAATDDPRVLRAVGAPVAGKVGIVTGGGSGHKPAFIGYLGRNMVDAVAVGEIFTSPSAAAFLDAFKAADAGAGVACLYGNYAGDNMNVKLARRSAEKEGIRVETVIANDDVPSAPRRRAREAARRRRRGAHVEGRRRQGRAGRHARRGHRGRPEGHRQHPQHRGRPDALHDPGRRQAQLQHRAGHDGGGHRPPRRARRLGRAAASQPATSPG